MSAKPQGKAKNRAAAKPKASAKAKPAAKSNGHAAAKGGAIAPTAMLAQSQNVVSEKPVPEKDEKGRFLPGNNGGPGRPPGAKNKLVEDFLTDFHEAWVAHGRTALESMVEKEPSSFVRAAVQLMPKDVLVDARGVGLVVVRLDDTDMKL
jgi:hypothetical protein